MCVPRFGPTTLNYDVRDKDHAIYTRDVYKCIGLIKRDLVLLSLPRERSASMYVCLYARVQILSSLNIAEALLNQY